MKQPAVGIKGTCPNCGEEVEVIVTKRQIKAIYKAFKYSDRTLAEIECERTIGRDNGGDFKL